MRGSLLMLSVLLAFITEHKGNTLTVYYLPRFPKVYVGDDITVICGRADSNKQTEWKINGTKQPYKDSSIVFTGVTPDINGEYTCNQNGNESNVLTVEVLVLEPYARLSTPAGGPVIAKGDARILTLQVDEKLEDWKCYVLRDKFGFKLEFMDNRASLFAEMKDTQRATFWCLNGNTKQRSNAVTLKMTDHRVMLEPPAMHVMQGETLALRCAVWGGARVEKAEFFKGSSSVITKNDDTYIIENASKDNGGQYRCNATFIYSHMGSKDQQSAESEPQELKVIGGPPVASLLLKGNSTLECSCPQCQGCGNYHWYHTDASNIRKKRAETGQIIYVYEAGLYTCRAVCQNGYSRFSKGQQVGASDGGSNLGVILAALLIVLGVLIIVVVAVKCRRRRRNRMEAIGQDKGDGAKDKSGGDYERIGLTDKAVYHTLGEAKDQAPAEGGYEALKKTETEEKDVYHMLGPGEAPSPAKDQAGYEALKNVKVQVYQTLSSDESKKPAAEAEGGYEQLPQKTGDYEDVAKAEENPYEELKEKKGKVDK